MSLIVPPFQFANCTDNLSGSPSSVGTAITAGANNSDASSVGVLSALTHDVHYIVITIENFNSSGVDVQALLDLLVDPSGGTSWSVLIDDLLCGHTGLFAQGAAITYGFPLWIPAGSAIGARAKTSHTADITGGNVYVHGFGNPSRPEMWWCGQRVESLGVDAANSKGTDITSGASNSFGSFTSVGSPTTGRYGAIQMGVNGADAAMVANSYTCEIGYGGVRLPGSPTLYFATNTGERKVHYGFGMPIHCDIPAGTQMQVRLKCAGAPEVNNVALYGVY